jgi:hypothetical protein
MGDCDLHLSEHAVGDDCGSDFHRKALAWRRAGAAPWSALDRRGDPRVGDWRDYLDGEPIANGSALELQGIEYSPGEEYGSRPRADGVRVRYETSWAGRAEGREPVRLHVNVGGHEFVASLERWMRFRRPPDQRR